MAVLGELASPYPRQGKYIYRTSDMAVMARFRNTDLMQPAIKRGRRRTQPPAMLAYQPQAEHRPHFLRRPGKQLPPDALDPYFRR